MRGLLTVLLISGMALGQAANAPRATDSSPQDAAVPSTPAASVPHDSNVLTIPAGTKIPLVLKQAISTKNAREGAAVYAATAFPFVVDNRVIIPEGSYIQGKIAHVERAGHGKGRAEIPDALYFDDLSQRIYRDAAGLGGEYARRGEAIREGLRRHDSRR